MTILNLDERERDILLELLDSALSDLSMEIADTDQMDFRETLKLRRGVLMKVRDALAAERA